METIKWEDLTFTDGYQQKKVKLNGTPYIMKWKKSKRYGMIMRIMEHVELESVDKSINKFFNVQFNYNDHYHEGAGEKQFFNDLNLVEEE